MYPKQAVTLTKQVSDIEGEIDLWTAEIKKNFIVIRACSYEEIVKEAESKLY